MADHTINELSALSGLSVRTIRYYQSQGLVPSMGREGPKTRYPESVLARLRLIVRMKQEHLPLAEIRARLGALTDDEVVALAGASQPERTPESALDYVRSLLAQSGSEPMTGSASVRAGSASRPEMLMLPFASFTTASPPPSAKGPSTGERSQWERIALGPDIEIHVRRPSSRMDNKVVARIIQFARELMEQEER